MVQREALKTLLEAADLISMVEDLFAPGVAEKLSAGSVSGMRLTLRGVRNAILEGHDILAADLVMKSKSLNQEVESTRKEDGHRDQPWTSDTTAHGESDHHV
jgi:hypothetical protein